MPIGHSLSPHLDTTDILESGVLGSSQGCWMDNARLYALFNSISVIPGRQTGGNERLRALEPHLRLKKLLFPARFESRPLA